MMLLRKFDLKMVLSECNLSSQKLNAIADLSDDIGEILAYLNTVLKGLQYHPEEKFLTVKRKGHVITFWPRQIAVTKLEDEKDAREIIEELKEIVNETYANRDHIKPIYTSRSIPRPLDVFKLLPGKNCKECGEPTCMAFALMLINNELEWKQCPLLLTEEFDRSRQKLSEIFSAGTGSRFETVGNVKCPTLL